MSEEQIKEVLRVGDYRKLFCGVILENNIGLVTPEKNECLDAAKVDYIIVDTSVENENYYISAGLRALGDFDGCELFRNEYNKY